MRKVWVPTICRRSGRPTPRRRRRRRGRRLAWWSIFARASLPARRSRPRAARSLAAQRRTTRWWSRTSRWCAPARPHRAVASVVPGSPISAAGTALVDGAQIEDQVVFVALARDPARGARCCASPWTSSRSSAAGSWSTRTGWSAPRSGRSAGGDPPRGGMRGDTLLLTGPSGSGKELEQRAYHAATGAGRPSSSP